MFPKRVAAKTTEAQSVAILHRVLPSQWIFRHQASDDYGIDVEIELVTNDGSVPGRFFKAQLKATEKVGPRKDGRITVSGIRQSTPMYWYGLSHHIPVVAFLVETGSESVYWTPVFWQATILWSGTGKTRSIEFSPADLRNKSTLLSLIAYVTGPTEIQRIQAHARLLRSLGRYAAMYEECCRFDQWCWLDPGNKELVIDFLKDAELLCEDQGVRHPDLFSYQAWASHFKKHPGDDLSYYEASEALRAVVPLCIAELQRLQALIRKGEDFWARVDPSYRQLVLATNLPEASDPQGLLSWFERHGEGGYWR